MGACCCSGAPEGQGSGDGRRRSPGAEDSRRQGTFDEESETNDTASNVGTAPEVPNEEIILMVPPEDSRRSQVVGKFLKALEQGSFDEKSENYNTAWDLGTAPEVPPEEIHFLVLGECRRHGIVGVSSHVMPSLIRLCGRILTQAAKNWFFSIKLLHAHGWMQWFRGSISLSLATAGVFAVPQLPSLQPLLLTCKSLPGGAGLKRPLWIHIATYLAPVPQHWWHRVRAALLLPCGVLKLAPRTRTFNVLKPRDTDIREYYSVQTCTWLVLNNLPLHRDWEDVHLRSESIPQMLADLAGISDFERNCFGEVCIEDAVLAIGICLRLEERIPVLLVGEFDDGSDVAISLLVSKILGLSHEVTTAEDFALHERTPSVENSRLVLARCSQNALHREEELRKVESEVFEGSNGGTLALASLHCSEVTVLDLQLQLPRSLQAAVVFR